MRSMLFTPALRVDRAVKAWSYLPDAVILDLEDSIPLDKKQEARESAAGIITQAARPWYVRINSLGSDLWLKDIETVLHPHLQGILIPKVETAEGLKELDEIVAAYELAIRRTTPIQLLPTIETVGGYDRLRTIARASERIDSLTFGVGDFCLDLGIEWDAASPTIIAAKTKLVIESRLAQLNAPHDGVHPKLRDGSGLYESSMLAKRMGFGCKHCIHPEQLPIVNEVFSPSSTMLLRAEKIVEQFEAALESGSASMVVDGEFVDYPVYYRAQHLLKYKNESADNK